MHILKSKLDATKFFYSFSLLYIIHSTLKLQLSLKFQQVLIFRAHISFPQLFVSRQYFKDYSLSIVR